MLLTGITADDRAYLTSDDEGRYLSAAIFGTDEKGFGHIVTAGLDGDSDAALAARVVSAAPLTGLTQGVVQALSRPYCYLSRLQTR